MDESEIKQMLFPHSSVRRIQDDLIREIASAVKEGKDLIAHAPTGLGKTAAALAPAVAHAIKNDLTVFFLTSRHTQHIIAIDTLKNIKEKYGIELKAVDEIKGIHKAQLLTYMKLSGLDTGLLINFNVERLTDGIQRFKI